MPRPHSGVDEWTNKYVTAEPFQMLEKTPRFRPHNASAARRGNNETDVFTKKQGYFILCIKLLIKK